jgi:phosphoglycerate dehydrogenase-like enzyme
MARQPLAELLQTFPSMEWILSTSEGIDFVTSDTLVNADGVTVTNAKGMFKSTLAEYTMMACAYFAKDVPRLLRQKGAAQWARCSVLELRGSTLGVVGYGDIGRAAARLASAYGMKVVALRRNPEKTQDDPLVDVVYGNDKE